MINPLTALRRLAIPADQPMEGDSFICLHSTVSTAARGNLCVAGTHYLQGTGVEVFVPRSGLYQTLLDEDLVIPTQTYTTEVVENIIDLIAYIEGTG